MNRTPRVAPYPDRRDEVLGQLAAQRKTLVLRDAARVPDVRIVRVPRHCCNVSQRK